MKNCINCNSSIDFEARFCSSCGNAQPDELAFKENSNGDISISDNALLYNSDVVGTKITGGNVSYTNIHHAQDDTKKRVRCFYTGQGVALEDLMNCPSCRKDVAISYFNIQNKRCLHCDDEARNEYTNLVIDYLSDNRLDIADNNELEFHQKRLLLTDDETNEIKLNEKNRITIKKSIEFSHKDLADIKDFERLFVLNKHIRQADSIVGALYKKHPQLPEVSFYYYLNELDKKDSKLYERALESQSDDLFAYYFGGVAAIIDGKDTQAQEIIEKLSLLYEDYYYLNDALKLLSLAKKFDYQESQLLHDKMASVLDEIQSASFSGIHFSAYLGVLFYVDKYACIGRYEEQLMNLGNPVSLAFGAFLINSREKKLIFEKRKIDQQKQAEQERIELEKLERRKLDDKAKAEALKIELAQKSKEDEYNRKLQEKREAEKRIDQIKQKENRSESYRKAIEVLKKIALYSFLPIAFFGIVGYQKYGYYSEEKRLEGVKVEVMNYIDANSLDKAKLKLAEMKWQYTPITGGEEETLEAYTKKWESVYYVYEKSISEKLLLENEAIDKNSKKDKSRLNKKK